MNDGVRRSLLVAKIARLQAEDAMEAERIALAALPRTEPANRGKLFQMETPTHGAALGMMIQRAAYRQAQG
jgi:hypothetical protein